MEGAPLCDLWRDSQGSWPCPAQCPYRPPVEGHWQNARLWQSLCASCNTGRHTKDEKHCDEAQGNRELPVSPLQKDCISYFSFGSDGEIFANAERTEEEQERANATISILRLNTNSLVTARYDTIEELETLAVEEREPLLDLLCKRNARGAFAPYYFVPLRHFQRI